MNYRSRHHKLKEVLEHKTLQWILGANYIHIHMPMSPYIHFTKLIVLRHQYSKVHKSFSNRLIEYRQSIFFWSIAYSFINFLINRLKKSHGEQLLCLKPRSVWSNTLILAEFLVLVNVGLRNYLSSLGIRQSIYSSLASSAASTKYYCDLDCTILKVKYL